ncbi:hypothetical protein A3C98_00615 [Candidatus Roizmanbacteria bacterium RIFCSPHIGHO2_02_FULL_37_15]|uniref:Major facilitator superfamily (MFS) profile domain-containing protein n=1 Tax=Candidatus Roizmanbacteria bacterium RIFCSPLOWO2_01_FULL_37_16 TaxID=1802058 RepID=A0A1F7INS7_9BACT|nr:MAG: hypothetical protein A2859_02260 [Candidatus Roizmanbacteria bacterium RIFCSPHIGHO2_01_FULL_37_16b]OGK22782.1 MAG: hypothetical protein A3C98_00615 [Candidatus Roizmanbacteria bacterium RIFCSPHIGHO2_02_FULL_37_15]OGK34092.1 MAG: hypothetical protein A3F57_05335 [Candidatus Roizmanbacteria bacterium RIFCSPHIGHO2_12_FULL_36_11]OGK44922.1 MAG: hypothetical protein A3B40_00125 [Candidatus Roizmanbacteria bacterium RIFCSPLOWO2_01_FULL_37_16]
MQNKKFLNLFFLYSAYLWFTSFSQSVLPTHFLAQGLSLSQMMLAKIILFLAQTLILFKLTVFRSKLAWKLAIICQILFIFLVIKIYSPLQLYLASALSGLALYFFYVFYNIAHFEETPKEKRGYSSALMFSLPTFISIVGPILAGFILFRNQNFFWILSGVFFILAFNSAGKQPNFQLEYNLVSGLKEIKATRLLILIEGVWEALPIGLVPIFTLYFIKTPLEYGIYLTYLSLIGIVANLLLGGLTDRVQKRAIFLYPLTIAMLIITLFFTSATGSIYRWAIVTGSLSFLLPIFWNVSTALVVDSHPNLKIAIPARELMLALGRSLGLFLLFLSFIFEPVPYYIFYVLAGVLALYPLILFWNSKVVKRFRYL